MGREEGLGNDIFKKTSKCELNFQKKFDPTHVQQFIFIFYIPSRVLTKVNAWNPIPYIPFKEFLKVLLVFTSSSFKGPELMRKFKLRPLQQGYNNQYDPTIEPSVANVFASASFRFNVLKIFERFLANLKNPNSIF